jgi:hypothetical protein
MANTTTGPGGFEPAFPPLGVSLEIADVRYDGSDGEGSHFYAVTWALVAPTTWLDRRDGSVPLEFGTGPDVTSLVHVLSGDGEPFVMPLGVGDECRTLPRWIRIVLKKAVTAHLTETMEVAA